MRLKISYGASADRRRRRLSEPALREDTMNQSKLIDISEAIKQMSDQPAGNGPVSSVACQGSVRPWEAVKPRSTAEPPVDPDQARKRELAANLFVPLIESDIVRQRGESINVFQPGIQEIKGVDEVEARRIAGDMIDKLTSSLTVLAINLMVKAFTLDHLEVMVKFHTENPWYQAKVSEFAADFTQMSRWAVTDLLNELMNEALAGLLEALSE